MTVAEAVRPDSRVPVDSPEDAPEPYTQEDFEVLAASYPDLRMELTKEGRLIIMPPAGGSPGDGTPTSRRTLCTGIANR